MQTILLQDVVVLQKYVAQFPVLVLFYLWLLVEFMSSKKQK